MSSGIDTKTGYKFDLSNSGHIDTNCQGKPKLVIAQNEPYFLHPRIAVKAPFVVMIHCEKCGTTTIPLEFRNALESIIIADMLLSNLALPPLFLRFCRTFFGLTQKEVAKTLGLSSRRYIDFENEEGENTIKPNELSILKLDYLSRLKNTENISFGEVFRKVHSGDLSETFTPAKIKIPTELLMPLRRQAEKQGAVLLKT